MVNKKKIKVKGSRMIHIEIKLSDEQWLTDLKYELIKKTDSGSIKIAAMEHKELKKNLNDLKLKNIDLKYDLMVFVKALDESKESAKAISFIMDKYKGVYHG